MAPADNIEQKVFAIVSEQMNVDSKELRRETRAGARRAHWRGRGRRRGRGDSGATRFGSEASDEGWTAAGPPA